MIIALNASEGRQKMVGLGLHLSVLGLLVALAVQHPGIAVGAVIFAYATTPWFRRIIKPWMKVD